MLGKGGQVLAFAFDPATMHISSLPHAAPGQGLLLPVRPGPAFAFTDADLIYGTTNQDQLSITSYRFSTNSSKPVIDTRTCGMQPPLGTGPLVRSDDDVSLSLDDNRISISEGGPEGGQAHVRSGLRQGAGMSLVQHANRTDRRRVGCVGIGNYCG